MNIRQANFGDLERIMEIYAHARAFMAAHGNPRQWGASNWPPKSLIEEDISKGRCRVCEKDGRLVGVFYYDYGRHAEEDYEVLENGSWIGEDTYGVVHRIARDGSEKGIGTFCISWAWNQCRHLRIDTHPDNHVMQNFLTKQGFQYCGIVHVKEDNDPRFAYEKTIFSERNG